MDQIVFIVVFIFPGILINIVRERIGKVSDEETTAYEELTIALFFSLIILILSTWMSKYFLNTELTNLESLKTQFTEFSFLFRYIVLTLVVTALVFCIHLPIEEKILQRIVNYLRGKRKLSEETNFKTEWSEVFENPDFDLSNTYISVERDGQLITCGLLKSYSNPKERNKGLILIATNTIKEFLEYDKDNPDERFLDVIDQEYFDISTGTLFKFHNKEKIQTYMNNINPS